MWRTNKSSEVPTVVRPFHGMWNFRGRTRVRFALVVACILAAGAVQLLVISSTADHFARKSQSFPPPIAARISFGVRPFKGVSVQEKRTHPPAHEFVPVAAVASTRSIRSILY
jgi:hypothetical protein